MNMQGTVASFDEATRSGHVLTDDGVPLTYTAEALADHIRLLRLGQRVFLKTDPQADPGHITHLALWQ